ncbi:hypothetical protein ACIRU3_44460 [Streptomyces sp. NPDC101151]|uniref:hypothetical protein n=1 Tax=Streptomyces sp. NPDC101151 TaxID=3366115 RepID=UPI0037F9DF11
MNTFSSTRYAQPGTGFGPATCIDGLEPVTLAGPPAIAIEYLDWTSAPALALPTDLSRCGSPDC